MEIRKGFNIKVSGELVFDFGTHYHEKERGVIYLQSLPSLDNVQVIFEACHKDEEMSNRERRLWLMIDNSIEFSGVAYLNRKVMYGCRWNPKLRHQGKPEYDRMWAGYLPLKMVGYKKLPTCRHDAERDRTYHEGWG